MDLFGPVNVLSINRNSYCLVVIDDFSRFTWVFFLSNKAGVADLIKKFIVLIENQTNNRVKALHTDNETEFKNSVLNHFCAEKGIMRQYSSAHTHQQNGVAERRNRTLKDVARTMLCDSKLPVLFWAEAINTACYVQNRVLINKAQMKTPYEILYNHKPSVSHFRVFSCPCTLFHLDTNPKFNAKADDSYFIGYAARTAYRVYNKKTKQIVESYDVRWLEENETDARVGPDWLFDYTPLFKSINVSSRGSSRSVSGSKNTSKDEDEEVVYRPPSASSSLSKGKSPILSEGESSAIPEGESSAILEGESYVQHDSQNDTSDVESTPSAPMEREFMSNDASTASSTFMELLFPELISNEFVAEPSGAAQSAIEGGINIHTLHVSLNGIRQEIPSRIQRDHPIDNIIGQLGDGIKTRSQSGDVNACLYSCFISQIEPKNVEMDLNEPSWVDAMHEELHQFEKLNVWKLVELPKGKRSLDTRWVYHNKQDDSGVIVRNKA